jgi:Rod binding domain-containing protein
MDGISSVPLPVRPAPQLPQPANRDPAATAKAFESVFIGQMTKIMMDTAPTDGPFSGGHGEEMFRGVLAEQMGNAIAKRGGIGLAPEVLAQMLRMQGGKQ